MSSIAFRKPEFRLYLGYPDIVLTQAGRTLGTVAAEARGLHAGLARLAAAVVRARGRLVVVLPETEVWRGRLDLAGRNRAERRGSARTAIAGRLGAAPGDVAVVLGTRDAGGSFPVAGVRRSTLIETRALLAAVGLRPSAIVGAGAHPGFPTPPRLAGWSWRLPPQRRGLGAAIGAGAIVSLAVLLLGLPNPDTPRPLVAAPAAQPLPIVAEAPLLPVEPPRVAAVLAPAAPPPSLALRSAGRPKPRPAAAPEPIVTVATRNMPADLPLEIAKPRPSPAQRLAEITTAPVRAIDGMTAPLRRPATRPEPAVKEIARTAMPVLPAPAVTSELRPMRRPQAATPAAAAPAATKPASESASLAPRPRMRAESSQPAMLVASLAPEPLMQASIATAAAATVATSLDTPPPARPAAAKPAPVAAKPAPAVARAAPVVVRPKPVAVQAKPVPVAPLVKQVAPQRPVVVASTAPARQLVATPKPVPAKAKAAAKPPVKAVPVRQKVVAKPAPVRQVAKAVPQAPQPVPARAPILAGKPAKAKPATNRVGLSRGSVSLVGVFAGADGRHALVRLPNGAIERVKAGDKVQGVQIAAINADSVRLTGRGGDTLLRLPD